MKTLQDMVDLGYEADVTNAVQGFGGHYILDDGEITDAAYTNAVNRKALHMKLVQARDYFGGNFTSWPTMTTLQKDTANRQAQRALANVARSLLNDLSTGGD